MADPIDELAADIDDASTAVEELQVDHDADGNAGRPPQNARTPLRRNRSRSVTRTRRSRGINRDRVIEALLVLDGTVGVRACPVPDVPPFSQSKSTLTPSGCLRMQSFAHSPACPWFSRSSEPCGPQNDAPRFRRQAASRIS